MAKDTKEGNAYGFFRYEGREEDLLRDLPLSVERYSDFPDLRYELTNGVKNLDTRGDSGLAKIVKKAQRTNRSHVLKVTLPGEGNRRAAMELGDILNGVLGGGQEESFEAGIVYKRGKKYVFRGE